MASFVTTNHSTPHTSADRVESGVGATRQMVRGISSSRSLATLLLSAMASAVVVVADHLMDHVTEGHLLLLWMGLWAVAFAVLALFAGAASRLAARLKTGLDRWSHSVAQSRADKRLWADAQRDPRVMAELQAALQRDLPEAPECGADDARGSHIGYGIEAAHIRRGRALA